MLLKVLLLITQVIKRKLNIIRIVRPLLRIQIRI